MFSQFRKPQFGGSEWMADELKEYQPMNYSKADSDKLREKFLSEFESNPERKVFIGHPWTAGLGLNQLVMANYVIHFDHWWNPAITNQATARAHRPRQTKKVFVYHFWMESGIEEMILGKLKSKQALFDETIDSLSTFASEEILFALFGDRLKKMTLSRGERERTGKHEAILG